METLAERAARLLRATKARLLRRPCDEDLLLTKARLECLRGETPAVEVRALERAANARRMSETQRVSALLAEEADGRKG